MSPSVPGFEPVQVAPGNPSILLQPANDNPGSYADFIGESPHRLCLFEGGDLALDEHEDQNRAVSGGSWKT